MRLNNAIALFSIVSLATIDADSAQVPQVEWVRQLGSSQGDDSSDVAVDALGNIYISGFTSGALGGVNAGFNAAFVAKYDPSGILQWTRQLGTSAIDAAWSLAVDANANVYIAGGTDGALGGPSAGARDAFLAKYDTGGALLWTRQLGTAGSDQAQSVAIDGEGNPYISGSTNGSLGGPSAGSQDFFLAKYDPAGNIQWARQTGTSNTENNIGLAIDVVGNLFLCGQVIEPFANDHTGNYDVFLAKYGANGDLEWSQRLATPNADQPSEIAVDGFGDFYVSGDIATVPPNTPNAGKWDSLVMKFDSAGNSLWSRQLGTSTHSEFAQSVAVDDLGNVFISGLADGGVVGDESFGNSDVFAAKYDTAGNLQWIEQLGTNGFDQGRSIALDGSGGLYVTGPTSGSFGGPNAGSNDVFLVKLSEVPEPDTWLLVLVGVGVATLSRRQLLRYRSEVSFPSIPFARTLSEPIA